MTAPLTLVLVCDDAVACSHFYDNLLDTGLRVLAARNTQSAVMCSCNAHVDGVLICQRNAELGGIIGSDMKSLFPSAPVVLVSTGLGMTVPSSGLDAVCYTSALDGETASTMAMLFRHMLSRCLYENNGGLDDLWN